jgi:hypothetical protein
MAIYVPVGSVDLYETVEGARKVDGEEAYPGLGRQIEWGTGEGGGALCSWWRGVK